MESQDAKDRRRRLYYRRWLTNKTWKEEVRTLIITKSTRLEDTTFGDGRRAHRAIEAGTRTPPYYGSQGGRNRRWWVFASCGPYPMSNKLSMQWRKMDYMDARCQNHFTKQRTSRPHQYCQCPLQCDQHVCHKRPLRIIKYTLNRVRELEIHLPHTAPIRAAPTFLLSTQCYIKRPLIARIANRLCVRRKGHGCKSASVEKARKAVNILSYWETQVMLNVVTGHATRVLIGVEIGNEMDVKQ